MTDVAVITGASSGFGAATAGHLAEAGFDLVLGARRLDRLEELKAKLAVDYPERTVSVHRLDVTDDASVASFAAATPSACVLINNAGAAFGTDSFADAKLSDWQAMYDLNVLGVLRVTQAFLPALRQSGSATVVNLGSIAAVEPYSGGAGYNVAKHGLRAMTRVLRIELMGEPIRVCEIDPGFAETEFSIVRFSGDETKAGKVYEGLEALTSEDIAEAITWVCTRPPHVNIDSMLIMPRDQVSAKQMHRRPTS